MARHKDTDAVPPRAQRDAQARADEEECGVCARDAFVHGKKPRRLGVRGNETEQRRRNQQCTERDGDDQQLRIPSATSLAPATVFTAMAAEASESRVTHGERADAEAAEEDERAETRRESHARLCSKPCAISYVVTSRAAHRTQPAR